MYKSLIISLLLTILMGCSNEETGELLIDFPQGYEIAEVKILGTNTYFFTDSIIYRTTNDLVASIDARGLRYVDSILFSTDTMLQNFFIQSVDFTEPGSVTVSGSSGTMNAGFSELSGIGRIDAFGGLGFKINPNLEQMISCFTITSKRSIDSIFEGSFLPGLDTLYTLDSTKIFQLQIVEGAEIDINYCDPFTETELVTDFSAQNGLQNNDRIITHRTDFIFNKK